MVINMKEKIRL